MLDLTLYQRPRLPLCLSLTDGRTWAVGKESVIHPCKQKNEIRCPQATYLEHFLWWASPRRYFTVWSEDWASDLWRWRLKGLVSLLAWQPGVSVLSAPTMILLPAEVLEPLALAYDLVVPRITRGHPGTTFFPGCGLSACSCQPTRAAAPT